MQFFADSSEPRIAVTDLMIEHGAALPTDLREQLRQLGGNASLVDMVVPVGELLYARSAELPIAGKVLAAQLAAYRAAWGFHRGQDGSNGRALAIRDAMMREAGEEPLPGVSYGQPEEDPPALAIYLPVPDEPPIPLMEA